MGTTAVRAVISLGTNTARLLVARDEGPEGALTQIEHLQTGTRLGEGLRDDGPLKPEAVERTLVTVRAFASRARELDAEISCIATSAVRRADDRDAFARRVFEIAGAPLHVLDGPTEARASYLGATYGVVTPGVRTGVLDIGGGSTELAVGCDGILENAASIELGSVRIGERFPELCGAAPGPIARSAARRASAAIDAAIAPLRDLMPVDRVRCVAGTPLTLAAIAFGSHVDRVSGITVSVETFESTIDRLLDAPLADRRTMPGMLPQRADILAGGGLILTRCLRAFGAREAVLEANDLLLGYLLMRRANSFESA